MLVVIGHLISTVRTDTAVGFAVYAYIYLFHMPAMILLSGLFAKPEVNPKAVKSTIQLVVIWVVWELIWALLHGVFEQRGLSKNFLVSPAWTLWFLVSLATMRILLPYIARLKHPLLFSIGVALLAPTLSAIGVHFSAARTLAFLPFFVCGWLIRERGWLDGGWFLTPTARTRTFAWLGLGGVAALFAVAPALSGAGSFAKFWRIDKWLTHRDSYEWMFAHAPIGGWQPTGEAFVPWIGQTLSGIAVGALLLTVAAGLTLALLIVVPRGHSVVTVWGARTLYVYLLHGVVVWAARGTGVADAIGAYGTLGIVLLVVLATLIAIVLSMRWVTVVFRPIIEPKFDWLLAREAVPTAPTGASQPSTGNPRDAER